MTSREFKTDDGGLAVFDWDPEDEKLKIHLQPKNGAEIFGCLNSYEEIAEFFIEMNLRIASNFKDKFREIIVSSLIGGCKEAKTV